MDHTSLAAHDLWLAAMYGGAVVLLTALMLGLSHILGERHTGRTTNEPYESGIAPTGSAWMRYDVKYYLIAVFFVIFDMESVFIFAWAVAVREAGWAGYAVIAVFIGILLAALFYLWKMGALGRAAGIERDYDSGNNAGQSLDSGLRDDMSSVRSPE